MTEIYARAERAPTHSKRSTITLFKLKDLVTIYLMVGIPYLLFAVFVAGAPLGEERARRAQGYYDDSAERRRAIIDDEPIIVDGLYELGADDL